MNATEKHRLYEVLAQVFRSNIGAHSDRHSELMELIQLLQMQEGVKPGFFALLATLEAEEAFGEVAKKTTDTRVLQGFDAVDVHHRHRPLRIAHRAFAEIVERRYRPEPIPAFWSTRNQRLAAAFETGSVASIPEDVVLGYPACCARWHYDCFFARGIEAFCDVIQFEVEEIETVDYLEGQWMPSTGFYLPEMFFAGAVARGNRLFPFVGHVPCPTCVRNPQSETAAMNVRSSDLVRALDIGRHEETTAWAATYGESLMQQLAHARTVGEQAASRWTSTVKGRDAYVRHSRDLARALDLVW